MINNNYICPECGHFKSHSAKHCRKCATKIMIEKHEGIYKQLIKAKIILDNKPLEIQPKIDIPNNIQVNKPKKPSFIRVDSRYVIRK